MTYKLRIVNLSKRFGGVTALDQVSLSFRVGRVTALVGPNGAGKTTLFNVVTGLTRPDEGHVEIDSESLTPYSPALIARKGVGRLFQDVRIFGDLTVIDNLMVAFHGQIGESLLPLAARPMAVFRQDRLFRQKAVSVLETIGLSDYGHCRAQSMSFGQQKLLAIGRILCADPSVVLLDEPSCGISPGMTKTILGLIRQMADDGRTVVVIEHNMPLVAETADWVVFLDEGRVTAFGAPDEVLGNASIRRTYVRM